MIADTTPVGTDACQKYCREYLNHHSLLGMFPPLETMFRSGANIARWPISAVIPGLRPIRAALIETGLDDQAIQRRFASLEPRHFQMVFARFVDNYLAYFADLLFAMYKVNPEMLNPTEMQETARDYPSLTKDEMLLATAERIVGKATFGGLGKVEKHFTKRANFTLFDAVKDQDEYQQVQHLVSMRNVVVHRRGVVDRKYLYFNPQDGRLLGQPLPLDLDMIEKSAFLLTQSVFRIDDRAANRFSLELGPLPRLHEL